MLTQRAVLSDYRELLDFENRVFSINFLDKVPKLYADAEKSVACHGIIKDGGRIAAAIAAFPGAIETGRGTLRTLGIGSVAVDSAARGKGYMKDMMAYCNRVAAETNADLAFLSGSRGRYEHDGYRPCGSRTVFEVSSYFLRHFRAEKSFVFAPLKEDSSALAAAFDLYVSQPLHWARSRESFLTDTHTWGAESFAVRDQAGAFCGYLIFEKARAHIGELLLYETDEAAEVLAAFAKTQNTDSLTVAAEPWQLSLLQSLASFGEHITVEMPAAFKVFHWQRFLEVLGTFKARHFALPEGSLVMKIGDETLRVTVKDKTCTAVPSTDAPELLFSAMDAAVNLTTAFGTLVPNALFSAWAPLCPLGLSRADGV